MVIAPRKLRIVKTGMGCLLFGMVLCMAESALAQAAREETPPLVSIWAVQATDESREEPHFDRGLEDIRSTVSSLRYDTYRNIKFTRERMAIDSETRLRINDRYTLYITPLAYENNGQVRLQLRMEMQPRDRDKDPVVVLQSRQLLAPNRKMIIGGPRLEEGDLVIVLETQR